MYHAKLFLATVCDTVIRSYTEGDANDKVAADKFI